MKHRILIENTQREKAPFRGYKSALRRAIEKTLEWEQFPLPTEISVTLVSREEIARLNGEYRGIPKETDVLSFPLYEEGEAGDVAYLGDIILCPGVIFDQAKAFSNPYPGEMCLMAIHSTLHLLGWDHMEEEEKRKMFARQEEIFAALTGVSVKTES